MNQSNLAPMLNSKARECVPVTCTDYRIFSHKGFNYYLVDLRTADWNGIRNIIEACEAVEDECWKAQEVFSDYIRKCNMLTYAEKDGQVIGFDAITLFFSGSACLASIDESMVLKAFHGKNIARKLLMAAGDWIFKKYSMMKRMEHIVFVAVSGNPRMVNGFFRNAYARVLFDNSFKPSAQLIGFRDVYCRRHAIELVDERYPFCMKNLFPGSNNFDCHDKRFQFSARVQAHLPPYFDHMARGDAFAFMVKVPLAAARAIVAILMATDFGKAYFSREGMGLFSPDRHITKLKDDASPALTDWAMKMEKSSGKKGS